MDSKEKPGNFLCCQDLAAVVEQAEKCGALKSRYTQPINRGSHADWGHVRLIVTSWPETSYFLAGAIAVHQGRSVAEDIGGYLARRELPPETYSIITCGRMARG